MYKLHTFLLVMFTLSSILVAAPSVAATTQALTLNEAWNLAHRHMRDTWENAALVRLVSSDLDDLSPQTAGTDGKRYTWIASFTTAENHIELQITGGEITVVQERDGMLDVPPITEKSQIDSPEALQVILEEKEGFAPSSNLQGLGLFLTNGS